MPFGRAGKSRKPAACAARIMYRLLAAAAAIATVNAQSARVVTTVDNSGDTWCNGVKLGTGNGEHPTSASGLLQRSGAVPCPLGPVRGPCARASPPARIVYRPWPHPLTGAACPRRLVPAGWCAPIS